MKVYQNIYNYFFLPHLKTDSNSNFSVTSWSILSTYLTRTKQIVIYFQVSTGRGTQANLKETVSWNVATMTKFSQK